MELAELKRESVAPTPETFEMLDELAKVSEKELGYYGMRSRTKGLTLRRVLDELGIEPFSRYSVGRYQASKTTGSWKKTRVALVTGAVVIATATVIMMMIMIGVLSKLTVSPKGVGPAFLMIFGFLGVIAGCVGICNTIVINRENLTRRYWRSTLLNGYTGYVPEFALSHALEIKRKLPDAKLCVVELVEEEVKHQYEQFHSLADPFLVVDYGEEMYHIDVWMEDDFEQRYTK